MRSPSPRIGYVLKVYPRFSETFIVNEVLAHERAGVDLEIFSLRAPVEGRFHEMLARVRAPVTYLPAAPAGADQLWADLVEVGAELPGVFAALEEAGDEEVRDVHQALLLALEVRRRGITHLHAHFANVAATVARLAARFAGVPYSFTAHAKDIYWAGVDRDALTRKLRDADGVITVSDFNVGALRQQCPEARIERVYNGLELGRLRYDDPSRRPPRIVGVGRLVEKKGFADLIDACAILAERGRSFTCEIIGAGPLEQELRDRIAGTGVPGLVDLVGPATQDEVAALLRGAAAFAAPCIVGSDGNRDGLPTVLLEAMALGVPCVSTPVTGIPEAIADGQTGLLVPEHDAVALAGALERLLDDAALRARLGQAARALVEERFDVDRNAATMRGLLWDARPADLDARVSA